MYQKNHGGVDYFSYANWAKIQDNEQICTQKMTKTYNS